MDEFSSPEFLQPFRCDVFPERDRARLAPVGELDLAVADHMEAEARGLWRSGRRLLVIDLRGLSFIDSSGVRMLLGLCADARDGLRLELIPGAPAVQRVFELTGTLEALPFAAFERVR